MSWPFEIGTVRGGCYRWWLQARPEFGPCHPSDWRPVNPCQDSAARVPKASRSDASVASALAADLAGLHDAGAGGMACLRDSARHCRCCGELPERWLAGDECSPAPTWPARAKGRQPAPGASRFPPGGRPAAGGCCAAFESAVGSRGAIPVRRPATVRRAPRALEYVEKVITSHLVRQPPFGL